MLTLVDLYLLASYIGVGIWAFRTGCPLAPWAWLLSPLSAPILICIAIRERHRRFHRG